MVTEAGHERKPEHKVKAFYARNGLVVLVCRIGDEESEVVLTRSQAINRARGISGMIKSQPYGSDRDELQSMLEEFIAAIAKAKKQAGHNYRAASVSMYSPKSKGGIIL